MTSTTSLVSPTKPPLVGGKKPNNLFARIEKIKEIKAGLSPQSQIEIKTPFSNQFSTPLNIKPTILTQNTFDSSKVQQPSPKIIRPIRVTPVEDTDINTAGDSFEKKKIKQLDLPGRSNENNYKKSHQHLSINIPGPNSEHSEHPNSKGEN